MSHLDILEGERISLDDLDPFNKGLWVIDLIEGIEILPREVTLDLVDD